MSFTKVSPEEYSKLQQEKEKVLGKPEEIQISTTPAVEPTSDNVYDVMEQQRAGLKEREFVTPETDFTSRDLTVGTYGFGDALYDLAIAPNAFVTGTISNAATDLLLGLDSLVVHMENQKREKAGSPEMQPGESIYGDIVKSTGIYAPGQFIDEMKLQIEAARNEPNPEDRFNMAKKIAGQYGSGYVYMFGGLELAKRIPYLKVLARKLDPIMRKAILKNPVTTAGVELTGVLTETEIAARGGGEGLQAVGGVASTVVAPTPANILKRFIGKQASKDFLKQMSYKDFEEAAKMIQRVADPEVSLQNLNKILKDGNLPPNVRAPLEILLGDKGFTYLETVVNKQMKDGIEITARDKEFLQGLNKLLKPVTTGNVRNAEDWFRLSVKLFENDINSSTKKIFDEGLKELDNITGKLPDPEQISRTAYNSLEEAKTTFSGVVDEAWDIVDLDKNLPGGFSIFQDFKRIAYNPPTIKVDATNINDLLKKFTYDKNYPDMIVESEINRDFLIRLNTDDILDRADQIRQGVIKASGGNKDQVAKVDNFLSLVEKHRDERIYKNIPTGNAFSDAQALGDAYPAGFLTDVAQDINIPFESSTMKTLRSLADEYGVENLPRSAQELLNGERKIETIGDLYKLRKTLGVEGMKQMPQGQPNQQAFFANKLRTSILEDLSALPDEGNVALKRAIAYSREYNQKFKSGLVGKILQINKDGSKVDPIQALQGVFTAGGNNLNVTGKINTQQLLDAAKQFGKTKSGNISRLKDGSFEQQLQDYMVNLFVNQPGAVKDGSLVPGFGQRFYTKYKSILDMPEMKRAKGIVLNASGDTSVVAKMLDEKTSLAKVYAGYDGKESLGAVSAFLGGDITEGLSKMMLTKGGIQQLKELRRLVKSKEIPESYFTSQGITRAQVIEGIKDSVRIGLIKIGQQGESATSYSLLKDLTKTGRNFAEEGDLLPFLREAGFNGADIKHVQKFAEELDKYAKYITTQSSKGNNVDVTKVDNIFHSVIGLFLGGVGADFFSSGSSLAAASYIKNQTKNTLQRLSTTQANGLLNDAMSDPKLLEALLNTPTHFTKNQIAKRRPYLFKYLNQRGFDALVGPSEQEISERMQEMESRAPGPIDEFLQNQIDQEINSSNIDSIYKPLFTPRMDALNTASANPMTAPQSLDGFIEGSQQ